jgi:nucleotide-binding universal stress UspA family protein
MPDAILVLTDFSQVAEPATQRAALLARQRGSDLVLAHLSGSGPPDSDERLPRYAAMLARRHRLPVRTLLLPDLGGLLNAAADQAGLLVMGWPPPRTSRLPWSSRLFGLRLMWRLASPLLVVRGPATRPYARLLVAVGLERAPAEALLSAASAIAPDAELELFHAIDPRRESPLIVGQASRRSLHDFRRTHDSRGRQHLRQLSDTLDARRNRLMYTLGRGDPACQILVQQEQGRPDLVVTGRGRRPAWLGLLLGSTAGRLVQRMRCDLLVWPDEAGAQACENPADARSRLGTTR